MKTIKEAQKEKLDLALKKGYSEHPENFTFEFLIHRLREEIVEYEKVLFFDSKRYDWRTKATYEIADIKNILSFIEIKHNKEILG